MGGIGEERNGDPLGPRYLVIRDQLLSRIAGGEWRAGEAIPSETRLAKEFGVAPGTLRKAIDHLVSRHVLSRHQGKGTYVQSYDAVKDMRRFFRLVENDGARKLAVPAGTVWIRRGIATARERRLLRLADGDDRVSRMLRVRRFDDGAVMLDRISLSETLFPGVDQVLRDKPPELIYELYEKQYGIVVIEVSEAIAAVNASAAQARLIGCKKGSALLEIERTALTFDKRPVEMRVSWCETRSRRFVPD